MYEFIFLFDFYALSSFSTKIILSYDSSGSGTYCCVGKHPQAAKMAVSVPFAPSPLHQQPNPGDGAGVVFPILSQLGNCSYGCPTVRWSGQPFSNVLVGSACGPEQCLPYVDVIVYYLGLRNINKQTSQSTQMSFQVLTLARLLIIQ